MLCFGFGQNRDYESKLNPQTFNLNASHADYPAFLRT